MNSNNEYLGVPFEEKLVPFPNFASVLLQHAREFPQKIALIFEDRAYTYLDLLKECLSYNINDVEYEINLVQVQDSIILILALLTQGKNFKLDFLKSGTYVREKSSKIYNEIDYFDPPYVKLDDKAFLLKDKYEFSQYNVLIAAQAVGQAFKLFRDGAAYCPKSVFGIEDMIFGILAPLYFAKSIYFYKIDKPDFFQYAWNGVIESNLRDAVMVTNEVNYHENVYRLRNNFEQALGLGEAIGPDGKAVQFLGFEIIDGEPRGHCLGRKVL
jgi:hypothetical protein